MGVLRLTADGTRTREIAERLRLSVATVRDHLSAIARKTGGRNRSRPVPRSLRRFRVL
ncbi:LuxR C-terminal-related transcriptional regulator [Streptomyces sp. NPDC050164]|uniref:LuxR C-terminal-related transcriptional regulator n=1 Tax=Streptomyces sp. NPDC050164 TaxID=3365605 RepID=UPI0037B355B2